MIIILFCCFSVIIVLAYKTFIPSYEYISEISVSSKESVEIMRILRKKLENVISNTNYSKFLRKININESNQSFTLDKKNIFLKLKNDKGEYYNINTLMFVLLHEFTHVVCSETGHTKLFSNIFSKLLKKAILVKEYQLESIENYR